LPTDAVEPANTEDASQDVTRNTRDTVRSVMGTTATAGTMFIKELAKSADPVVLAVTGKFYGSISWNYCYT
jgi:hypothetical protein